MTVLRTKPGPLPATITRKRRVVHGLANVAAVNLALRRSLRDCEKHAGQLQRALDSRIAIEQAKGFLVCRYRLDMDTAFTLLRDYSRSHSRSMHEVARDVVAGKIDLTP